MHAHPFPVALEQYADQELGTFALVACAASKHSGELPAREKYAGQLFPKARDYVERVADGYAILSGKHGAIAPGERIDDYDVAVTDRDPDEWAAQVVEDLGDVPIGSCSTLIVLAGRNYREPIQDLLDEYAERWDVDVQVPLEGLGIGKQLAALNEMLEDVDETEGTISSTEDVVQHGGDEMDEFDEELWELRRRRLEEAGFSGRQAEIVAAKEQGLTHEEIAEELDMPKNSVDTHSQRARKKVIDARMLLRELHDDVYPEDEG